MDISRAIEFIKVKHKGQLRIGGGEYVSHPIAVSEIIKNKDLSEEEIIIALFHDLLEDTDTKESEILELSSMKVLEAVKVLTKYKGYNMENYITNIKQNELALNVKLADRLHNLRCALITSDEFRKKYIKETEKYYLPLSEGTLFKYDIVIALNRLKESTR